MGELEKKNKHRLWRSRQTSDGSLAPFGAVYLALLGLGLLGALALYLLLIAFVPGASGTRLDAMKTALLVVAGSGAGAGLYVQYRKQQTDEAKSALDHANSRRDQDKLFTERYTTAVAQLGNPAAAVRLGGVYALARIADDSRRDRPTCLKVLCAYLRMPYDPDGAEPAERQVRTTAQTVIAERLRIDHPGFWVEAEIDLSGANLINLNLHNAVIGVFDAPWATFSGNAVFVAATFGNVSFGGATFNGFAGFGEATFNGNAMFDKTIFSETVRFSAATFNKTARFDKATFGALAWFGQTTFSDPAEFAEATFSGRAAFNDVTFDGRAEFGNATFSGNATFDGARFNGSAVFDGATFNKHALFEKATFSGPTMFKDATVRGDLAFDKATFNMDHPPTLPPGFAWEVNT